MKKTRSSISIRLKESCAFVAVYLIFAGLYYTTLWFNRGGYTNPNDHYFNIKGFLNWGGLDYLVKLLLSLPVCWIMFMYLRSSSWYTRLIVHFITLPLFVFLWIKLYYYITSALGMYHLTGLGMVWDIYIPALFYILEFGILHAYMYFKESKEQQQVEAILREAALKSELSALKAQLNPHFLYNVFNTINAAIPADLENIRQLVAELSDLFRYQLQASKAEFVTLREELEFTRKYLDLEKARLEDRLQVIIDFEPELLEEPIPPMLIQPLVENAVKHGIAPMIEGGRILVSIKKTNERINVCVSDNGKGVQTKEGLIGKGTGLTNTALRLEKMFGTVLTFSDSVPHGLTVNFTIG